MTPKAVKAAMAALDDYYKGRTISESTVSEHEHNAMTAALRAAMEVMGRDWVMAPRVATKNMENAGQRAADLLIEPNSYYENDLAITVYAAMLAASPNPETMNGE